MFSYLHVTNVKLKVNYNYLCYLQVMYSYLHYHHQYLMLYFSASFQLCHEIEHDSKDHSALLQLLTFSWDLFAICQFVYTHTH